MDHTFVDHADRAARAATVARTTDIDGGRVGTAAAGEIAVEHHAAESAAASDRLRIHAECAAPERDDGAAIDHVDRAARRAGAAIAADLRGDRGASILGVLATGQTELPGIATDTAATACRSREDAVRAVAAGS